MIVEFLVVLVAIGCLWLLHFIGPLLAIPSIYSFNIVWGFILFVWGAWCFCVNKSKEEGCLLILVGVIDLTVGIAFV